MMARGAVSAFQSRKQMQADKMKELQKPAESAKTQAEAAQTQKKEA